MAAVEVKAEAKGPREAPCKMWDITVYPKEDTVESAREMKDKCIEWSRLKCKKWAMQIEKVAKYHIQWRVDLATKVRKNQLKSYLLAADINYSKSGEGGVSQSNNKTQKTASFDYVMKPETRVEGPWDDRSDGHTKFMIEQEAMLKKAIPHMFDESQHRPCQRDIIRMIRDLKDDFRSIYVILDIIGGAGKNDVMRYLRAKGLASCMPRLTDSKKTAEAVASASREDPGWAKNKPLVINFPRGTMKDSKETWSQIEQVRDGDAVDTRYKYYKMSVATVPVFIFCNELPDMSCLSADRWKKYIIDDEHKLLPYSKPVADLMSRLRDANELVRRGKEMEDEAGKKVAAEMYKRLEETFKLAGEMKTRWGLDEPKTSRKKRKTQEIPEEPKESEPEGQGAAAEAPGRVPEGLTAVERIQWLGGVRPSSLPSRKRGAAAEPEGP